MAETFRLRIYNYLPRLLYRAVTLILSPQKNPVRQAANTAKAEAAAETLKVWRFFLGSLMVSGVNIGNIAGKSHGNF